MILASNGIIASQITQFVGLLDTYPNAAAAYSLRKLRSAYTGYAIKVRRSSDNTEQDIGFSSSFGLDTSSLTSFCGAGDGFVTTWYDQSGNGYNATQSTAANQPQIVSGGSVIVDLSNKPSLKFSGNQWIYNASTFNYSQPFTNFTTTRFSSITSPTPYPYIWRNQLGGNDANLVLLGLIDNKYRIYAVNNLISTVSPSINSNLLFYGLFNGASSAIGVNNTNTNGSMGSTGLINGICFGTYDNTGSAQLNGFLSESIFYGSNQSTNQTGISTNINTYYGIY